MCLQILQVFTKGQSDQSSFIWRKLEWSCDQPGEQGRENKLISFYRRNDYYFNIKRNKNREKTNR